MIIVRQDKEGIVNFNRADSIWICSDEKSIFTIEATADTNTTLGCYKTKARVKEVLQEITNTFSAGQLNGTLDEMDLILKAKAMARYEMPKE